MRVIVVLALALSISGCGMLPKKETPEQAVAASRFYPGKSIDQVRAASIEVLNLLAPGKMEFDAGAPGIAAKRTYGYVERRMGYQGTMTTFYNVNMTAVSWYTVALSEEAGGTRARFALQTRADDQGSYWANPAVPAIHSSFRHDLPLDGRQGTADLKLFHDRVEHVLGLRPNWVSCGEVKEPGKVLELCDRSGISDVGPIRS
ncbi:MULTISPECIES: hypothetical protein [Stenotrophomonas maltophilia group]|uniref:hypothetical protein n=1 Tax=Stenotrophomonas maltophilia group TaxID=995085 RepID=UPI001118391A|nr:MULTISPECIES: hypothetical protein [Stenotrophomonas]MCF3468039.1 hypothetical protein [Stenotrophomonas maltophilia]MCF3491931.1 hypothetical protein [Stenotrophomonas maltophilia]MCF3512773.1 hypothetical protein [Stenotrophomonas maltophilia]MCU1054527.1 hypothetical protein [Stenotrophomonas maltophilia]